MRYWRVRQSCCTKYAWNGPTEEIRGPETCAAISEVTNMVMGSVKSPLQEDFDNLESSE